MRNIIFMSIIIISFIIFISANSTHVYALNTTDFNNSSRDKITVVILSDNQGAIIANQAVHELIKNNTTLTNNVQFQVRSCSQIEKIQDDEFVNLISNSKIFIGEWISDSVSKRLQEIFSKNKQITNKKDGIFLILEPAPGYINLMRYSNIKGKYLLENFSDEELYNLYQNTKRGLSYDYVKNYLSSIKSPEDFNRAVLYKDLNNVLALKEQILWALNRLGFSVEWHEPDWAKTSSGEKIYGIYRYGWYDNLTVYAQHYFKTSAIGCVGIIESTMYVGSQQLGPYYALIDALEKRNINVIPVVAYGATPDQLKVMVESFTDAPNVESFFANPSKYKVYVDAIISMPAFGLGGDNFTDVIKFFEILNVPVFRAIHSDYISAEQWEISSQGIRYLTGDKWWHIAVPEAQGIINPTIVATLAPPSKDPITGLVFSDYKVIDKNIELLADTIKNWILLKRMPNSEKKNCFNLLQLSTR